MLNHGRLILTASGLMLDEVKSLLWKSLRRKDTTLATRATIELCGRGKDQLPWRNIIIFLFEDHCLNDIVILSKMKLLHQEKDKRGCIELLLNHCYTCRVAACLPLIAMDTEYDPTDWNPELTVDVELVGLLVKESGSKIDFDLLMQHLKNAWVKKDAHKIITYMKMTTMVVDHDKRSLTMKGMEYCLYQDRLKNTNVAAVVLSMLSKTSRDSGDKEMESYTKLCCYFTKIPDAPMRLIMFAAVAQLIHHDLVKQPDGPLTLGKIKWDEVEKLDKMPSWAVDRHTFRGKSGKGTTHILKKADEARLSETELEEFHGPRPKRDIKYFFEEGVLCNQKLMEHNPYWDRCQELYLQQPKSRQKAVRMTAVYYKEQLKKFPAIKGTNESANNTGSLKRKSSGDESLKKQKTRKKHTAQNGENEANSEPSNLNEEPHACSSSSTRVHVPARTQIVPEPASTHLSTPAVRLPVVELETETKPCLDGPLLQLPTGSAKVYTRVDLDKKEVWKGPYRDGRANLVMFFHRIMKEVFGDPHTLKICRNGNFIKFPLLCDPACGDIRVTIKDFYDCIGKKDVKDGKFVNREDLGVIQIHKMAVGKFRLLPASFWCHFLFRYVLNIGDSGLYNSITNKNMTFISGIDMEEARKNVKGNDLVNIMFSKLPRKEVHQEIQRCAGDKKDQLVAIMNQEYNSEQIKVLATFYHVPLDEERFNRKLYDVRHVVEQLVPNNNEQE